MKRPAIPIAVIVLAASLVGLLVYGLSTTSGSDTTLDDAVKRGQRPTAPGAALKVPLLDGTGTTSLAAHRGEVVVLNFWASWCGPCEKEAPLLQRFHERLQRDGTGLVLGSTFNDTTTDARAFEREYEITYPSMRDVDTSLYEEFGGTGIPETFVLDREGRVVAISRGQVSKKFLDDALARAVAEQ